MKLSEALIRRADVQKRIQQIRQRLQQNALIQEGDAPAEDPTELLAELRRTIDELNMLIKQINRTNAVTPFDEERTLTDALADRDTIMTQRSVLTSLAEAAVPHRHRYSASEVKFTATVDVADIRQEADDLARQYRELDTRIQELNWSTDLVEE